MSMTEHRSTSALLYLSGVTVSVPPFIVEGEKIRVNPTEARYMERVK